MQATLSSTASGQLFRTEPFTAPSPALPCNTFSALETNTVHIDNRPSGNRKRAYGVPGDSVAEGAGLAHDAGNLLGALGLYCELLALPGVLRDEHRHYAEELQMLSERSWKLVDRLLNPRTTGGISARSSARTPAREPANDRVAVPDVIDQCRGLLETIARRAVEVAYEAGSSALVPVPREALERILVNLTKNAAEASRDSAPNRGAITLRVSCLRQGGGVAGPASKTDRIVLSVEDKGCGMSTAAVKVLMGANRLAPAGPRGIGFQVVRELVGASGGQLRLKSSSGSGTTVEIEWAVASKGNDVRTLTGSRHRGRPSLVLVARNSRVEGITC